MILISKSLRKMIVTSNELQSMRDRLKSSSSSSLRPQSSFSHRSRSAKPSPLLTTPPNALEMGLKRIEILASRAGFNMSSIPRRSQLQIVSRLSEKLPVKLSSVVKSALKSNDVKVYEYLPEPSRDPLIEDDPEMLGHFLLDDERDDFEDVNFESKPRIDASSVSITADNYKPENVYSEADLSYFKVPEAKTSQPTYEFLRDVKDVNFKRQYAAYSRPTVKGEAPEPILQSAAESKITNHRVAVPDVPKATAVSKPIVWSQPKRVVVTSTTTEPTTTATTTTTTEPTTTTTTTEPPTTTTTTTEPTTEDLTSAEPTRISRESKKYAPIKVSIIDRRPTSEPQVSSEDDKPTKYVEVQPIPNDSTSNKNTSNLLFQVESESDSDLTEDEIAAMVEELQKYEEGLDKNLLEFDYQRLLEPHPLEYPDHPDHQKQPAPPSTATPKVASCFLLRDLFYENVGCLGCEIFLIFWRIFGKFFARFISIC
jgi:hypothetical protein